MVGFFVSSIIKESFRKEQGKGLNVSLVEVYEKFMKSSYQMQQMKPDIMGQMDLHYLTCHLTS